MLNPEYLQKISDEVSAKLGGIKQPLASSQALKSLVKEAVAKLDLVSREDYERLLQIHQRTRQRVDELNSRVADLEAKLKN
ncbi:accessory factor UbiK family protein [Marinospirillum insulare]|uniref:Ubiquinone biosynthesis accessory factor UbiK n=1 Tax=Marinospirillum insulare TaxID=217169 RepID=A0ABQ5ZZE5_9GAMM|nr:accessory factor UbiK family protein [Marinospirillum insulare]GLR64886.1 hypothetical protein GCM10007878_23240 [Marinospirillum insulare]